MRNAFSYVLLVAALAVGDDATKPEDRTTWRETQWSALIAEQRSGVAEYRTPDGSRVDVLVDDYAIEVDWCEKWPEAIGQALFYGLATNRKPGVVLLMRGRDSDQRYYLRCLAVCSRVGIRLETMEAK